MKTVKSTTGMDITTSVDSSVYTVTPEGTVVPDEVAETMKTQFLHTVEVSDYPEVITPEATPTETPIVPEDSEVPEVPAE